MMNMIMDSDGDDVLSLNLDTEHSIPHISMKMFDEDDIDVKECSAINDERAKPIELDGQHVDEEDCFFMFDCFDSEEVLDALPLKEENSKGKELRRMRKTTDIKSKKRLGIRGGKKKRKFVSRRKRCSSSTDAILYAEQANKITRSYSAPEFSQETTPLASITQVLRDASFNQAYQDTLSNLAISMKRSAFSRMRVLQHSFPISPHILFQTKDN